jgi:hypothetical protein
MFGFVLTGASALGRAGGGVCGEFLDPLHRVMQRPVRKRVGQKVVRPELEQLVQRAG